MPLILDSFDREFAARTSPAEWQRILRFRRRPRFLNALFAYADLIPAHYANNIILNKVVTEAWRFEMLVYTLYLYDQRDPAIPTSGLTLSNLQRICAEQNCASKGRVLAILGIMRIGGFLRQRKSEHDSRIKHLEPSKKFVAIVEGWNNRLFQIIDAVVPEGKLAAAHLEHPRFGWNMRRLGAETLLSGWKLLAPFPEVEFFVTRDGGWMFLLTCVAEALRASGGKEIAPVAIALEKFGPRFGVSRSHLRRLLEGAYQKDLVLAPPQNGNNIILTPKLVAAFLNCMASELSHYQQWALATK